MVGITSPRAFDQSALDDRRGGGRVDPGGDNNFIKKRLQIVS